MKTHFEYRARPKTQRLADLEKKTAELERKLSDARESLDQELAHYGNSWETHPDYDAELTDGPDGAGHDYDRESASLLDVAPLSLDGYANHGDGPRYSPGERTAVLINHGRPSASRPVPGGVKIAASVAVAVALAITVVVVMLPGQGPTWPASVATVQAQITKACENPDVSSEPGQVNFACAKTTRQILWVFALLTSGNDPASATGTGREGLEPITPAAGRRGGVVPEPPPPV